MKSTLSTIRMNLRLWQRSKVRSLSFAEKCMVEAMSTEQGFQEEEAFVVRFLEGYRFIKELQRSGGGLTLV